MQSDLIEVAQNLVARCSPLDYYSTYRQHEIEYWYDILGWLDTDIHTSFRAKARVLDIGCAYGTLLAYAHLLGIKHLYGIDQRSYISFHLLAAIDCVHMIENIETSRREIGSSEFDAVIFTEVLEHLNFQPVGTLNKIRRALADNGRLYLSTPNSDHWGRNYKYYPSMSAIPPVNRHAPFIDDHIWHYDESELRYVLQCAGFEIVRFETGRHFQVTARKR